VVRRPRRTRATCRRPARASWRGSGDTEVRDRWGTTSPADRWGTRRSPSRRRRRRGPRCASSFGRRRRGRGRSRWRTSRRGPPAVPRVVQAPEERAPASSRSAGGAVLARLHGGAQCRRAVVRVPTRRACGPCSCRGSARRGRRRHACDVRAARRVRPSQLADHVHLRAETPASRGPWDLLDPRVERAGRSPSIRAFDFDAFGEPIRTRTCRRARPLGPRGRCRAREASRRLGVDRGRRRAASRRSRARSRDDSEALTQPANAPRRGVDRGTEARVAAGGGTTAGHPSR